MNNELRNIISRVRQEIDTHPDGPTIGELNEGNSDATTNNIYLKEYIDFLKVCNGARCGPIDIISFEDIERSQHLILELPGFENWLYIGQILYDILVINKDDGNVWIYIETPPGFQKGNCLGRFYEFIKDYVFGKKFIDITPSGINSKWYQLLEKLQIV